MVEIYGFHVGKYTRTSPMDPMGMILVGFIDGILISL